LRDVHLKDGSMWRDVLQSLKHSMPRLLWVSLRRIGYVPQFEGDSTGGAEVPDDQPWALSDSDTDEEEEEDLVAGPFNGVNHLNGSTNGTLVTTGSNHGPHDGFDSDSDTDNDHEPEDNATDFPDLDSPTMPTAPSFSDPLHDDMYLPNSDLDDDGFSVSNAKRKAWEQWVTSHTHRQAG
jgi:hypothetical protein